MSTTADGHDLTLGVPLRRVAEVVDVIDLPVDLSPWRRAFRRFASHKLAVLGFTILLLFVLLAIFADVVAPYHPNKQHLDKAFTPPDGINWLGTDLLGRDVFSRILAGARISLSVGTVGVAIYLVIAIVLGSAAGLIGGRVDNFIMRFTDLWMTFPSFVMILIAAGILGPSIFNIMIIIGVFGWPGLARLIRGQLLLFRELDYVIAARTAGASIPHLAIRHMVPNILGPVAVAVTLGVAGAILAEAGLSFLGLGVTEPTASWGSMISSSRGIAFFTRAPWMWLAPGAAISLTVLSINFIGDGLRDAFDVRGGQGRG
ncbi:MAG: ABC transporter permease [Actinobacteria bacterium]|nr:ABC transporter permease [Actinomycetota bacterium]